jgi:hypothetical protein
MGTLPSRYALSIAAAALLAACGALRQAQGDTPPGSAPGAIPQGITAGTSHRGGSWMLPAAKSSALLYVATGDNVFVLSYPHGRLMGSLNVSGYNLCSDEKGDIFVPTSGYVVLEYAHGGASPIATLHGGDIPLGCAIDPTTGNLAVTQEGSGAGEVAIFPNAKEPAAWYRDPAIFTYGLCGYDDRGNLFVDGSGSGNVIAELSKGSGSFTNFPLTNGLDVFGGIQWDGRHIAFSNPTTDQVFGLRFGKTKFKIVGATQVNGWQANYLGHWPYVQTWLQSGRFIAQSSGLAELGLWRYPAGGNAGRVLGPFESGTVNIYGITISVAPHR